MEANKDYITEILDLKDLPEDALFYKLGIGLSQEYLSEIIFLDYPYQNVGNQLWSAFLYEAYNIFCDRTSYTEKEWVKELVEGDIRSLALGIITAISARYEVSMGIAVPITALFIKRGLHHLCLQKPKIASKKSVKDFLNEQKTFVDEFIKTKKS